MPQSEAYHGRNELRHVRRKAGLSQTRLAHNVGVSCAAVSAWESGKRNPSDERIPALAKALGIDSDSVLRMIDQPGEATA